MFKFEKKFPLNSWVLIDGNIINLSDIDLVNRAEYGCTILFKHGERMFCTEASVDQIWNAIKGVENAVENANEIQEPEKEVVVTESGLKTAWDIMASNSGAVVRAQSDPLFDQLCQALGLREKEQPK